MTPLSTFSILGTLISSWDHLKRVEECSKEASKALSSCLNGYGESKYIGISITYIIQLFIRICSTTLYSPPFKNYMQVFVSLYYCHGGVYYMIFRFRGVCSPKNVNKVPHLGITPMLAQNISRVACAVNMKESHKA